MNLNCGDCSNVIKKAKKQGKKEVRCRICNEIWRDRGDGVFMRKNILELRQGELRRRVEEIDFMGHV